MDQFKLKCISLASPQILLLFLLCLPFSATSDLNTEKQALLSFANAIHHGMKLNWNLNTPLCSSWVGITCTRDQTHVFALRLPGIGLSGQIPQNTLSKLNHLQVLSLRCNRLSGNLPIDILSLPSLHNLYLQHNYFSGKIPTSASSGIISLDLSFNSFSGEIPLALQNLSQLAVLNLQNNSFSGPIPDLKLRTLNHLNLSYNNLNGSIPSSLQNFTHDSFVGNIQLCGPPLSQCSSILPSPSPSLFPLSPQPTVPQNREKSATKKLTTGVIIVIVAGGLALFLLITIIFILCVMKKKDGEVNIASSKAKSSNERPKDEYSSGVQMAKKNKLVIFDGCSYNFDLEDLLRASAEVLGKGSFGTAYKAVLEDGSMVVVKRLKEVIAGKREFEQQMDMIGRAGQHQNLVPVRAYYYSKDEKLMVYDYAPGGSFSSLLHGNRGSKARTPLDWDTRLKILLGAAKAIFHLHTQTNDKLIHGNIKSSNILLTQNQTPIVSDYGLTPVMHPPSSLSRITVGYRAPELVHTGKQTSKSDVYSFGVVLLEMLTGKSPVQAPGCDDVVDLPRWVSSVVREEWTAEVFDVELMRCENVEEEMVQMLQLGLACVARVAEQRPTMEEVVKMMEEIKRLDCESRQSMDVKGSDVEIV